jgi:hypothetical protein
MMGFLEAPSEETGDIIYCTGPRNSVPSISQPDPTHKRETKTTTVLGEENEEKKRFGSLCARNLVENGQLKPEIYRISCCYIERSTKKSVT